MDVSSEHKLLVIEKTNEHTEWKCIACQRHVKLSVDGVLKILDKGDQTVTHRPDGESVVFSLKNSNIDIPTIH